MIGKSCCEGGRRDDVDDEDDVDDAMAKVLTVIVTKVKKVLMLVESDCINPHPSLLCQLIMSHRDIFIVI